MCLRLASPPHVILARLAVRTTASKKLQNESHVECMAEYQRNGLPLIG